MIVPKFKMLLAMPVMLEKQALLMPVLKQSTILLTLVLKKGLRKLRKKRGLLLTKMVECAGMDHRPCWSWQTEQLSLYLFKSVRMDVPFILEIMKNGISAARHQYHAQSS